MRCGQVLESLERNPGGRYLDDYCRLCDAGGAETSLASCLVMYFGYGAALFLLGFSAAGGALIPHSSPLLP